MQAHLTHRLPSGFSLLEMIGVLAVMGVLAAMVLPLLIRSIDRVVSERETAHLESFESALQQSIMRTGTIAAPANLPDQIATELGWARANVASNARRQPRFFLVDPALEIGSNAGGLPYTQTDAGSVVTAGSGPVIAPVNPRLMILSSLGQPLSGFARVTSTNDFNSLWNTPDGTLPPLTFFASWGGRPADLKIKRINLSGLFVHLLLDSYPSASSCKYSVVTTNYATATAIPNPTLDAYFLKNTTLILFNADQSIDSKQVLIKDGSFVYDQSVWRGSLDANVVIDRMDLRSTVSDFLGAFPNPNAALGASQSNVVQAMMGYMAAYNGWAASNFLDTTLKGNATTAQAQMMSTLQGLCMLPSNPAMEVACP
jgi:prepilin-type N-terminal cleavage/methylation domain-containing protein